MNSDNDSRIKYYRWWPVVVAIPILLFTAVEVWQRSLMPEDTYIPAPVLPTTNAKDYFARASAMANPDTNTVAPPGTPASEIGVTSTDPFNPYKPHAQAELKRIIASNTPAIKLLEQGLKYPYMDGTKGSVAESFRYFSDDRKLAHALRLAAVDSASKGDYADASNDCVDGLDIGSKITHGAGDMGMMSAESIDQIGRSSLRGFANKLDYKQCEITSKRIEKIDESNLEPFQSLVNERRLTQGMLLDAFKQKRWRSDLFGMSESDGPYLEVMLYFVSPRKVYNDYTSCENDYIQISKRPWPDQLHNNRIPKPGDLITKDVLLLFAPNVFKRLDDITANRLLELQFALRAYKLAHGVYPFTLSQLSPALLSRVPNDPFSENQMFKYKNEGNKYLLYSIGPDAVDDGGTPIYDMSPGSKKHPYEVWKSTDKGDIVAGINYF